MKSYYLCTAKIGTFDDYIPEKRRPEQKWFYLTHGSLSLKNTKGKLDIPPFVDYILFPSENVSKALSNIYNIEYPSKRALFLGMPVDDIFYSDKEHGHLHKLTNKKYRKTIIWLPTFRKKIDSDRNDSDNQQIFGLPLISNYQDIINLNNILQSQNILLIIKYHPMQDMNSIKHLNDLSNVIVVNNKVMIEKKIDLYHLLKDTDALITDYSSVSADYMHMNKPTAYTRDDINIYNLGIVEDFDHLFVGDILISFDDLIKFINNVNNEIDAFQDERNKAKDFIFKYSDGNASKRLIDFIENIL